MSVDKLNLCVVVPMYNEESGAAECVEEICKVLAVLPHRTMLLVVDDGSTDRTYRILNDLRGAWPLLSVRRHERNGGYGRAMLTAFEEAAAWGGDYVLVMDSDLTNDPKYIPDFVRKMEERFDVIKASRYVEGGGMIGVPLHRELISIIGNRIASWMMGLPLSDCTNGFRAARVDILSRMPLSEPGFAVIMEELYYSRFLAKTFCEIPYILTSRGRGKGLSKFTYRPKTFWEYLRYVLKAGLGVRPTNFVGGMADAKGPQAFR